MFQPKHVVTSKLHFANKIIYSQVVFDSTYPYNCIQHNWDGSLKDAMY